MDQDDVSFEDWFDMLQLNLADSGITFSDMDSVRAAYESGRSMFDVMDEIKQEYSS